MTRFSTTTVFVVLAACDTEADRGGVPSVVDMPATGPGPTEVATSLPPEKVDEGTARMPFDHAFLNAMIEHHKGGEDAAKLALTRAEHPELKTMAQDMITTDLAQALTVSMITHAVDKTVVNADAMASTISSIRSATETVAGEIDVLESGFRRVDGELSKLETITRDFVSGIAGK